MLTSGRVSDPPEQLLDEVRLEDCFANKEDRDKGFPGVYHGPVLRQSREARFATRVLFLLSLCSGIRRHITPPRCEICAKRSDTSRTYTAASYSVSVLRAILNIRSSGVSPTSSVCASATSACWNSDKGA